MTTPPDYVATCPSCNSSSIQALSVPKQQLAKAMVTEYFLGHAAGVAAGTSHVIQNVCLKCGTRWLAGTSEERRLRIISGQYGDAARQQFINDETEREALEHAKRQADDERLTHSAERIITMAAVACVVVAIIAIVLYTRG